MTDDRSDTTVEFDASAAETPVMSPRNRYAARVRSSGGSSYRVRPRLAFAARITRQGAHWLVEDDVTGIFGVGDIPSEAIADFEHALSEHLDVLRRQEALSPDLAAQLGYLEARIAPS